MHNRLFLFLPNNIGLLFKQACCYRRSSTLAPAWPCLVPRTSLPPAPDSLASSWHDLFIESADRKEALSCDNESLAFDIMDTVAIAGFLGSPCALAARDHLVSVYTDGCCLSNGRADSLAAIGVYFGPQDARNFSERLPGPLQTNNRAELYAVAAALARLPLTASCVIYTDSCYVLHSVTHIRPKLETLISRKTKPILNVDLISRIADFLQRRKEADSQTHMALIKGHAKIPGNEAADALARSFAKRQRLLNETERLLMTIEKAIEPEKRAILYNPIDEQVPFS